MGSFFEQFKKQMEQNGLNLDDTKTGNKKSDLLVALEKQLESRERGPLTHSDHGSFTRHSSDSAVLNEKNETLAKDKKEIPPQIPSIHFSADEILVGSDAKEISHELSSESSPEKPKISI